MVAAHFAGPKSMLGRPTHSYPYVDGMAAFVLLSGLVFRDRLRRVDRATRRSVHLPTAGQAARRALPVPAGDLPGRRRRGDGRLLPLVRLRPVGDAGTGIGLSLLLRYLPSGGDILLMYLVFLAVAGLLLPLLRRGFGWLILVTSIALYAYSQFHSPDWFFITSSPGRKWIAAPDWSQWWTIAFGGLKSRTGRPGGSCSSLRSSWAGTGAAGGPTSG